MTGPLDPYREWDAAYLLGALSPAERREYEAHLAGCPRCSAEIASLAGLSGILAAVPPDKAMQLAAPDRPLESAPPDLLPRLAGGAERIRRRARRRTVALIAAAAAVAAAVVWVIPTVGHDEAEVAGRTVSMVRVGPPRPLRASAHLVSEPWGTRIEASCSYDLTRPSPGEPPQRSFEYAMFVTDRSGGSVKVATWLATPGTTATPYATTTVRMDQIAKVDIRSVRSGAVLLKAVL
jgi:Putative zinc-finger